MEYGRYTIGVNNLKAGAVIRHVCMEEGEAYVLSAENLRRRTETTIL